MGGKGWQTAGGGSERKLAALRGSGGRGTNDQLTSTVKAGRHLWLLQRLGQPPLRTDGAAV